MFRRLQASHPRGGGRRNKAVQDGDVHSGMPSESRRSHVADRVVYPAWDPPANRSLPARSYFYYLQPVGVGSAQVESLTSYLTRLAEAHNVTPNVLLNRELLWKVREVFRRHAYRDMGKPECTFVYKYVERCCATLP